ncbi:hypothetical protein CNMCM8980_009700 [Aspergillus fumigatiaffinis]|uniref:CCZ1/INTU/HSP4 first Longin domain-containing protein n=1 Tax=Aspergillus fumigatiaffinis TaxID=340414 RepID=A0A8H4MDV0_9EURO|nr:hypothetical protein CNMCM6805_001333 [Aspergillus fumigatiaffinis]KAF4245469.1 hypothetical protein CNMCM8980_009700 [Aspergillus fumigatiaffinis]
MPDSDLTSVVPAQLSFLAIYNPLLGPTDESIGDQVVFYTSRTERSRRNERSAVGNDDAKLTKGQNERLRQIGLAQGMVSFARNFSEGKSVDYVETEKSTVILHELEENWWILASIDLTRLPNDSASGAASQQDTPDASPFYYSSREICPPQLLKQQLRRAHSIFLLHHELTLQRLYDRVGRSSFCIFLERFWSKFAWSWDILLTGNPTVELYNGIKLSAGGELGIGVGEEEWGSGEREVLEDYVLRTDGLVDLVVSRFGDPPSAAEDFATTKRSEDPADAGENQGSWLGSDVYPRPSDGVIFSGAGNISRSSLVQVSQWMEWIFRYGYDAYGVGEDPTSPRRRKRRRGHRGRSAAKSLSASRTDKSQFTKTKRSFAPGIPPPLVVGTSKAAQEAGQGTRQSSTDNSPSRGDKGSDWIGLGSDTLVKYLTFGYGSSWRFPSGTTSTHPRIEALKREETESDARKEHQSSDYSQETSEESAPRVSNDTKPKDQANGKFIIGLRDSSDIVDYQSPEDNARDDSTANLTQKIVQRTLYVQRAGRSGQSAAGDTESVELRVVVYVNQPFIYTFLFDPQAPSLNDVSLYQSIHHQLAPLQRPLSNSTSPANAAERIFMSENAVDFNKRFSTKNLPVYDLVYDPTNLTIRSSIPNIPDLGYYSLETSPWSRVESLNIHQRLLSTYAETRLRPLELERTCKTSRGWWIVWVRITDVQLPDHQDDLNSSVSKGEGCSPPPAREAFLVRKASDHISASGHARGGSGTRFFRDLGGASSPGLQASRSETGPGKLVEGLGLDARRYIENLLRLNR